MKKSLAAVLISIFVLSNISFAGAQNLSLTIDAKASILIEASTGKVLYENNPDERLPLASVTKVMTMLLIYEALEQEKIKWNDIVTISEHASKMGGSQVFLEIGEQQTVRDLLKSIIIASANDASVAMAEFIAGSEESFVDLMNKKAVKLNMANTKFQNACGLDADNHYSSARDIAIMSREFITRYPESKEYTTTWMDTIVHKTARGSEEFGLTNTNKLVKWYRGALGLKTGSTGKALFCLSAAAERDDMKLIAVVMAAPTPSVRFQEAMKMLDYGFANYKVASGETAGTKVGDIIIQKGGKDSASVIVKSTVTTVLPKGNTEELSKNISFPESISAPIRKGDKVGQINYRHNGADIGSSDLILDEDIERASFLDMLKRAPAIMFQ